MENSIDFLPLTPILIQFDALFFPSQSKLCIVFFSFKGTVELFNSDLISKSRKCVQELLFVIMLTMCDLGKQQDWQILYTNVREV